MKFTKNELFFQHFRRHSKISFSHLREIFVYLFTFPLFQFRFSKSSATKRLCEKNYPALLERDNNIPASYKCNNNSWQLLDNSVHYPIPALIQAASNSRTKCVPLNVSDQFYFLWIPKVWGIFLQGRVGGKFRIKIATFYFYKLFWHLFVVFHYKMCVDHLHIF